MADKPFINLFTDFGFKKIFATESNKDILIHLLNTILAYYHKGKSKYSEISDVIYLKNEWKGISEVDRSAIFDLHCQNQKGEIFIVEMQCLQQFFFKDRTVFYGAHAIQAQGVKGKWNYRLAPVYVISFLNFVLDYTNPNKFISCAKLIDTETLEIFYDKLTFVYIELVKFLKDGKTIQNALDEWLFMFKNMPNFEKIPPQATQNPIFLKLFEQCEIANYSPTERIMYDESVKIANDWFAIKETMREEGREEGRKEGREEGREEGRKEGRKIVISNLVKKNFSNETISEVINLPISEIEKIRKELEI